MAQTLPIPPTGTPYLDQSGVVSEVWRRYLLSLENAIASHVAPIDAQYWVSTANSELTNERNIGALSSGYLTITTAIGVATPATSPTIPVTDLTGTLPIAKGGTNSATALSGSSIVISDGSKLVQGAAGTTATVLHGNAGGAPSFGAVALTADVSGILPAANGGTGIAFFAAAGPSVARTYTFPDASTTVLTTNAAVTAAQGGTGQSSYTIGDLLYASGATALSKLADAAVGNALIAGGAGVAPSYGKIGLTTHVSGLLPVANGGTAADLSATGGTGKVLKQASAGAAITVATFAATELSDYVSTTWTPTGNGVTVTVTKALVIKIGAQVTIQFDVTWPVTVDGGQASLAGLPYTPVTNWFGGGSLGYHESTLAYFLVIDTSKLYLYKNDGQTILTNAEASAKRFAGTVTYFT